MNHKHEVEVVARAERRHFTAPYKQQILDEIDHCAPGQIGSILRREGLYSSNLTKWREERRQGQLKGLTARQRGRKPDPQAHELMQLRSENEQLQAQLKQAELINDAQKKLAELFGMGQMMKALGTK